MRHGMKLLGVLVLTALIFSCEQPFKAGLGPKTDITVPQFVEDSIQPASGSFLAGKETITGIATDDIGVERVEVFTDDGGWQPVTDFDKSTGKWSYTFDTEALDDGEYKLKFRVFDADGKEFPTDNYSYTIKNRPPQIEMTLPRIQGAEFDDPNMNSKLAALNKGTSIMGLASDMLGIMENSPEIQFWPVALYETGFPPDTDSKYGPWRPAVVSDPKPGLKATEFRWPMKYLEELAADTDVWTPPEGSSGTWLEPGEYRFRLRIRDLNGKWNYYPNRVDRENDGEPVNEWIQITYTAVDIPQIVIKNIPAYYNSVGDFVVDLTVIYEGEVDWVKAAITASEEVPASEEYKYAALAGDGDGSIPYALTIPASETSGWPVPADGNLYLHLKAMDDGNQKESQHTFRNFIYDVRAPEVVFNQPVLGVEQDAGTIAGGSYSLYYPNRWVTGRINVGGINKDQFGVDKVYYHIGYLGDDNKNQQEREAIYADESEWTDTGLDTTDQHAPDWSGSVYAWTYTHDFNHFKLPGISQEGEDIGLSSSTILPTEGEARFYLPFYVKVLDKAGNRQITQYKIFIDPDMDIPQVSFTNPDEGALVGGEVRISGSAIDDLWIHHVQIRVLKKGNADDPSEKYYTDQAHPFIFPTTEWAEDPAEKAGWIKLLPDGNPDKLINWSFNLNGSMGALHPKDGSGAAPPFAAGVLNPREGASQPVPVEIQVRAVDTKDTVFHAEPGLSGPPSILNISFSTGVPVIDNPKIEKDNVAARNYTEGLRASGKFKIKAVIHDDEGIGEVSARITGQAAYTKLIEGGTVSPSLPAGWSISAPQMINERSESVLEIEVDTTDSGAFPSLSYGRTGNFVLDVQVADENESPYTSSGRYTLGIDNFYPSTDITTKHFGATSEAYVSGKARDYGTGSGAIQGTERMLVYFERGGVFYNGNAQIINAGEMATYPKVRDKASGDPMLHGPNSYNAESFANFPKLELDTSNPNLGDVYKSPHAMVIDRQELGAATDTDGDGTYAEMWQGNADRLWQARLDTTQFIDGPLDVHYIIMDQAGNATHYKKSIYIGNYKPMIASINPGTDINGNGEVAAWTDSNNAGEYLDNALTIGITPSANEVKNHKFTVRNGKFNIRLETMYGNGSKHYKVNYVTPVVAVKSAAEMVTGNVYTIVTQGDTDFTDYGALSNSTNATFVATGAGTGSGTVREYAYVAGAEKTGVISTPHNGRSVDTVEFTDFANIPDSIEGGGEIELNGERYFVIKIYDSTVAGGTEMEQLAHAVVIQVDTDNVDEQPPFVEINPFFWKSADDNSLLYGNDNKAKGHIELEGDLPAVFNAADGLRDRDPKVSGQISIRGSAGDNNTIEEIYFKIDGFSDAGATVGTGDSAGYYRAAVLTDGTWNMVDRFADNGWKFTVEPQSHNQKGHRINWKLDFDTSRVAGVASLDRGISLIAKDIRDSAHNYSAPGTTQTTEAAKTPYYRVDVVPYISGIETIKRTDGGLKSGNIRSAAGKYSVIQGTDNTFITVTGFNLNPAGVNGVAIQTTAQRDAHANNPATTTATGTPRAFSGIANDRTSFKMTNNSNSGYLAVQTNGVWSLNNINNNDARGAYQMTNGSDGRDQENMPNREADRGISKNITLTDDRYLQFYTVKKTTVRNGYNPVMLMEGNDPVFGYVDLSGGGGGTPSIGNNSNAGSYISTQAMPQRSKFNGSNGARIDTEYLIKGISWDGMGMAKDESGRYIHATTYNMSGGAFHIVYDRYNELQTWNNYTGTGWGIGTNYSQYKGNTAGYPNNNAIPMETVNYPTGLLLDRYQYPKLIAKGNSYTGTARNYLAYYDSLTGEVVFRSFRIGQNSDFTNRLANSGQDAQGRDYNGAYSNLPNAFSSYTYNDAGGGGTTNSQIISDTILATWRKVVTDSTDNALNYFDMAITSNNVVIIAYYDESSGKLKIKYSGAAVDGSNPTANITWNDFPGNAQLPMYTGMYVSMAIDSANRLHIAAYDSIESDLKYIFIPKHTEAAQYEVTVDQYGSVGNWTDIKLQNGVPYIAYYNATETGGRDAIKLANAANAVSTGVDVKPGVDEGDFTTGNWEYRTVPAIDPPQGGSPKFQKVNLGFRTDGRPVLGYLGTNIEFSYPIGE